MEEIEGIKVSMKMWLLDRKINWDGFLRWWTTFYGNPSLAWWWDWYREKGYRKVNYATSYSDTSGKANSS